MVWRTERGDHDAARRTSTASVPARRIWLRGASALLSSTLTTDHASALHRVCSITRKTRLMRSHGCQRRASLLFTIPSASLPLASASASRRTTLSHLELSSGRLNSTGLRRPAESRQACCRRNRAALEVESSRGLSLQPALAARPLRQPPERLRRDTGLREDYVLAALSAA